SDKHGPATLKTRLGIISTPIIFDNLPKHLRYSSSTLKQYLHRPKTARYSVMSPDSADTILKWNEYTI
ncbi:MAG: hypothetical protein LBU70_05160, partial [Chitinispirillales bacterium]|nr:hypothetical protein [Chitinispirillales bacterium]